MKQDEIIEMAKQAHGPLTGTWWDMDIAALDRFAKLVAAKEREACAKLCDELDNEYEAVCQMTSLMCGEVIRARGES